MTVTEVAGRLKVATRTVWRWAASGLLPAPLRLSKRVKRWRVEDIERFVESAAARAPERVRT
jgi:excisionase family DNA binding protein